MSDNPNNSTDEQVMYHRLLNGLGPKHCVFSHTAAGIFKYVSPSFKELFDISDKEIIGKDWRQLQLTEESLLAGEAADQRILTEKKAQKVELTSIHSDGSEHIIEVSYAPVFEGDQIVMMDGICIDITERKLLEKKLQKSEQRFKELIKRSSDTLVLLDANGIQTFVSDTVESVLGYTAAELTNIPVIDSMIHPEDQEKTYQAFQTILDQGEAIVEYRHRHKEGHWVHLEARGGNELANPNIEGIIINVRDISKRKKFEDALQESEAEFRSMIECSPAGIYLYELNPQNNELILQSTNRSADRILGISNAELIGKTIEAAFPALENTHIPEMFRQVADGRIGPQTFEIPYKDKEIDTYNSVNVYQISTHKIAVVFTDISERKRFEGELIESKKKSEENEGIFRKLFEASSDPILLLKGDTFIKCNTAAIRFLGIQDKDKFLGFSPADISPEFQPSGEKTSDLSDYYINKAHEEGYCHFEWVHLRKDKTPFLLEITLVLIVLKGEELLHVTWRDITEKKRNEEALHKRIIALTQPLNEIDNIDLSDLFNLDDLQKLQDRFATATGVATIITKPDGTPITKPGNFTHFCQGIIRKNQQGCANCEKSDAHIGRMSTDGPNIHTCLSAGLWDAGAAISVGGKHIANWLIGQVRDETQAEEDIRSYARKIGVDEEESVQAFYQVHSMSKEDFNDIAEMLFTLASQLSTLAFQNVQQARLLHDRKKFEDRLVSLNEQLKESSDALSENNIELQSAVRKAEESDRLKSAFLANMSHEIRTPMNAILGFSSLMREEDTSPEVFNHYIDIITESGEHLMRLIDDIIDLSKIDACEISISNTKVNIQDFLDELKILYVNQLASKNKSQLRLEYHIPTDISSIEVDKTRLKQILTNLLGNAIKFTSEGSIEFGCKKEGETLLFWVKDSGIGILKDHYKLIFDRFKQATTDTEKLFGGTGLGLSIAKACVKLLGGKIWLESELNVGSTFYFTIPYKSCETLRSNEVEKPSVSSALKGKKVLVAEDDERNFEYIEILLKNAGMDVTHAKTGKEALDKFSQFQGFDILLMDIQMPEMDGILATQKIREFNLEVPILALTAFAFEEDKKRCLEAGCNEYLQKPASQEVLLKTLASLLIT